jgi:hypothetical protein
MHGRFGLMGLSWCVLLGLKRGHDDAVSTLRTALHSNDPRLASLPAK